MKLQINIDTESKEAVTKLLKLAITAYNFDKESKASENAAMANKIIDILEGK
ncbi:MAG: hypothetical protein JKX72_02540 [Robiginitomaculum sp.]|nr:hypothetical protein [Robiginitomaculum sp.]